MDYKRIVREERQKFAASQQKIFNFASKNDPTVEQAPAALKQHLNADVTEPEAFTDDFTFCPFAIEEHRLGSLPNLFYIPKAITAADEFKLLESIAIAGATKSDIWKSLKNRRLQSWGKSISGTRDEDMPLPLWLQRISDALVRSLVFDKLDTPNHVLINEYTASDGIFHHTDGPVYLDLVSIVSLGSPCLMTFRHKLESHEIGGGNNADVFTVLLQPRSLLIFSNQIYTHFMHGIACGVGHEIVGETAPCLNMELAGVVEGHEVFEIIQLQTLQWGVLPFKIFV